jgi:hypothetical protein
MQGGLLSSFIWPTYLQGRGPTVEGINWKRPTFCLLSSYLAPTHPHLLGPPFQPLSSVCRRYNVTCLMHSWVRAVEPIRRQLKIVGLFQYNLLAGPPVARKCYDTFLVMPHLYENRACCESLFTSSLFASLLTFFVVFLTHSCIC